MEQPPPTKTVLISYVKKPVSESVTKYYHNPPDHHVVVIDTETYHGENGANNQQHSGSGSFTIESSTLCDISRNKELEAIGRQGGVEGIAAALKSDLQQGLKGDVEDISCRIKAFGTNSYAGPPKMGNILLYHEVLKDPTTLILLICAALSLGLGMKLHGAEKGWYDGGSIFVALLLFGSFTGIISFRQSNALDKIFEVNNNVHVKVLRYGKIQHIPISEIVVGDIISLSIGDRVPADGLFSEGISLVVDESRVTGASDHVGVNHDQNPFLLSGTDVVHGHGRMLVTSVGMNTRGGMTSIISREFKEETPLQKRLKMLVQLMAKVGVVAAFLVLVALLIRYFTGSTRNQYGKKEFSGVRNTSGVEIVDAVVRIIAAAVTIAIAAIPAGLPLAVLLTRAYSTKKMIENQARVKNPSSCEIMGSVTTICIDVTGLSSDQMKVTESYIGKETMQGKCYTFIEANVLQELFIGISVMRENVYKLLSVHDTDDAIHSWAVRKLNMEMESTQDFSVLNVEIESPYHEDMRIGIVLEKKSDKTIHVHWRGRAETILSLSSHYYDTATGSLVAFDEQERETFHKIVKKMVTSEDIHCFALAHRRLSVEEYENEKENQKIPDEGLILLGLVSIKNPCQPGVKVATAECQLAGVDVIMITDENVSTAGAIAKKYGIVRPGNVLVGEGDIFRHDNPKEQLEKAERICADKLRVVQRLKAGDHIVAVTCAFTRDIPALYEADIGLSMGIAGTQVVKEYSDIVILDDNLASVPQFLKWGRCFYNNVQKWLQFQLTINVSALLINFVAATSTGRTPLTPAQLLWVNFIMDALAALAIATEKPSEILMTMPPRAFRDDHFITKNMWRNIISQALYQIAVILVLIFKSKPVFAVNEYATDTLVFTIFVLLQVFNLVNARRIEEKNVFEGIIENKIFLGIIGAAVVLQVVMVEFLCQFAHTKRLDLKQWGFCMGIAAFSWVLGFLVKITRVPKCLSLC